MYRKPKAECKAGDRVETNSAGEDLGEAECFERCSKKALNADT